MIRIQVLLSEAQNEKLTYLAKRLKTSKSQLFREAVEIILRKKVSESSDPLLGLIGQAGEAGRPDISTRHDEYLSQMEKEQWTKESSL